MFHVHMHLIPRYKGDVEKPKGGVRGVIPNKQSYTVEVKPKKIDLKIVIRLGQKKMMKNFSMLWKKPSAAWLALDVLDASPPFSDGNNTIPIKAKPHITATISSRSLLPDFWILFMPVKQQSL